VSEPDGAVAEEGSIEERQSFRFEDLAPLS